MLSRSKANQIEGMDSFDVYLADISLSMEKLRVPEEHGKKSETVTLFREASQMRRVREVFRGFFLKLLSDLTDAEHRRPASDRGFP